MWLELFLGLLFLLISGAGSVLRTVAASARELQASLQVRQAARVERERIFGVLLAVGGMAGAVALAVRVVAHASGDAGAASLSAALMVLLASGIQFGARG